MDEIQATHNNPFPIWIQISSHEVVSASALIEWQIHYNYYCKALWRCSTEPMERSLYWWIIKLPSPHAYADLPGSTICVWWNNSQVKSDLEACSARLACALKHNTITRNIELEQRSHQYQREEEMENISKVFFGLDLTMTKPNKLSPGRCQSVSTLTR